MSSFQTIRDYLLAIPQEMVALIGVAVTALGGLATLIKWYFSWRAKANQNLALQHRSNYLQLEFESSRVFTVVLERPEIPRYLRGELSPEHGGKDLQESTSWFICQILNLFEIAVSFHREGRITGDLLATWVAWFHELGTSMRFGDYWVDLRLHYKYELQQLLDRAQKCLTTRPRDFELLEPAQQKEIIQKELRDFFADVAKMLHDRAILTHYQRSVSVRK